MGILYVFLIKFSFKHKSQLSESKYLGNLFISLHPYHVILIIRIYLNRSIIEDCSTPRPIIRSSVTSMAWKKNRFVRSCEKAHKKEVGHNRCLFFKTTPYGTPRSVQFIHPIFESIDRISNFATRTDTVAGSVREWNRYSHKTRVYPKRQPII